MKRKFASALMPVMVLAAGGVELTAQAQNHWQETMHHPARMHHAMSSAAKLDVTDDPAAQTMTVRIGPVNLPAHSDHMAVMQPRDLYLTLPFDGWLVAFHPRLVDAAGNELPGKLLHHVAYWSASRPDFLCPNKPEHIFGAGSEMNDWPGVPGFGYRVADQDRILVATMFANPTATSYPKVFLEVRMEYRRAEQLNASGAAPLHSVYPVWFDVMGCRDSGYDLKPGPNVSRGQFTMKYSGILLGVGGHLHDYGRQLVLEEVAKKQPVATLDATVDPAGHLISVPIVRFADHGLKLAKGEMLGVTATYDNPTGKYLADSAMGIVVGYFLPEDDAQFVAMARPRK